MLYGVIMKTFSKLIAILLLSSLFFACTTEDESYDSKPQQPTHGTATSSVSETEKEFGDWTSLGSTTVATTIENATGTTTLEYAWRKFTVATTGDYLVLRIVENFSDTAPWSEAHQQNASYTTTWYKKYFLHTAAFGAFTGASFAGGAVTLTFANKTCNGVTLTSTESIERTNVRYKIQNNNVVEDTIAEADRVITVQAEADRFIYVPARTQYNYTWAGKTSDYFTHSFTLNDNRYRYGVAFYENCADIKMICCAASESDGPSADQNAIIRRVYYSEHGAFKSINNTFTQNVTRVWKDNSWWQYTYSDASGTGYSYKSDGTFCTFTTATKSIYPKMVSGQFELQGL